MPEKRKLEMSISLSALEHLGMNLYSNVPSVLSEIVANAWDADASKVDIGLDKQAGKITIDDNGMGQNGMAHAVRRTWLLLSKPWTRGWSSTTNSSTTPRNPTPTTWKHIRESIGFGMYSNR